MRWSASTSSQDWTDETLARIRQLYARHTSTAEGSQTEAQGIKLDTGTGAGRLPLARYLDALQGHDGTEGLSPKYLQLLREAFTSSQPGILLDPLRAKFRNKKLTAPDIEPWQQVLWRFANVGHIGKQNGPKAWQEPVTPLVPRHEMRVKLGSAQDVTLYLSTTDAGDGNAGDEVVWENPRLVAPGRPDLPISGLPALVKHLETQRERILANTEACLMLIPSCWPPGTNTSAMARPGSSRCSRRSWSARRTTASSKAGRANKRSACWPIPRTPPFARQA
jgi:hypothetical protein